METPILIKARTKPDETVVGVQSLRPKEGACMHPVVDYGPEIDGHVSVMCLELGCGVEWLQVKVEP